MSVSIRGFVSKVEPLYKRIKVEYNSDDFTRSWIAKKINKDIHNPTFQGGFWIKYTNSTVFEKDLKLCTLENILHEHIIVEAQPMNYNYSGKMGWYIRAKSIRVES